MLKSVPDSHQLSSNFAVELCDGVQLLKLVSFYEGMPIGKYHVKPVTLKFHRLENMNMLLEFMRSLGFSLEGVDARRLIECRDDDALLRLVWSIVVQYLVLRSVKDHPERGSSVQEEEILGDLLAWCNDFLRTSESGAHVHVEDWSSFQNGVALCAIVTAFKPGLIDINALDPNDGHSNVLMAFESAKTHLGIPRLTDPKDFVSGSGAREASIVFTAMLRNVANIEYAIAIHAYKGGVRKDRELVFGRGERIEVLEKHDEWWRGSIDGAKVGWFPASYVRVDQDSLATHLALFRSGKITRHDASKLMKDLKAERTVRERLEKRIESLEAAAQARLHEQATGRDQEIASLAQQVQQLTEVLGKERKKRFVLEQVVEDDRTQKRANQEELAQMREEIEEVEALERRRQEEYRKNASVMEDLIANSHMLPDLMLATTQLEMRIDELEWENNRLREQLSGNERAMKRRERELLIKERDLTEAAIAEKVASSGNELAKRLQEQLVQERAEAEQARRELENELELLKAKSAEDENASKEEMKMMKALVKKYKSKNGGDSGAMDNTADSPPPASELSDSSSSRSTRTPRAPLPPASDLELNHNESAEDGHRRLKKQLHKERRLHTEEKDEIIALHLKERKRLEKQLAAANKENTSLSSELEEQKARLMKALREFEAHKGSARDQESAAARYKVELLQRLREAESENDAQQAKIEVLEAQLDDLYRQNVMAEEEIEAEKMRSRHMIEEAQRRARDALDQSQAESSMLLQEEILKAESEVERIRRKMAEERMRREQLEAAERARQKLLEERAKAQYAPEDEMNMASARGPRTPRGRSTKNLSAGELMSQYQRSKGANQAVQIYPTDNPEIFLFGTRKINIVVLNGQLMVRVGGGYAAIDEFVAKNAPSEARKLRAALRKTAESEAELSRSSSRRRMRSGRSTRNVN